MYHNTYLHIKGRENESSRLHAWFTIDQSGKVLPLVFRCFERYIFRGKKKIPSVDPISLGGPCNKLSTISLASFVFEKWNVRSLSRATFSPVINIFVPSDRSRCQLVGVAAPKPSCREYQLNNLIEYQYPYL